GDSLVVGGGDHRTGQDPVHNPFDSLESWARKSSNFIKEVRWRWSGQVFEPMDRIAYSCRNPGNEKNGYISTGESGIGMTSAVIASQIIPDLIEKGDHPWKSVFDPSRSLTSGIKEYIQENINVAYQYFDWVTP